MRLTELQNKYRARKKTACWYKLWADGKERHIQQEWQRVVDGLQNVLQVVQAKAQAALTESAVTDNAVTESAITDNAFTESAVPENAVTDSAVTGSAVSESAVIESTVTETAVTVSAVTGQLDEQKQSLQDPMLQYKPS